MDQSYSTCAIEIYFSPNNKIVLDLNKFPLHILYSYAWSILTTPCDPIHLTTPLAHPFQGGSAGDAYGFTLSSLDKLKDTRANKPQMTLLHYITELCEREMSSMLDLEPRLPHLEAATK